MGEPARLFRLEPYLDCRIILYIDANAFPPPEVSVGFGGQRDETEEQILLGPLGELEG